jgi:hypothetical protein
MVKRQLSRIINMSEFELIFDENKKEWFVRFSNKKYWSPQVSVKVLINPNEEQSMFLKALIYQKMLQWLKDEHQEFFI